MQFERAFSKSACFGQVLSVGAPKSKASPVRSRQRSFKAPPAPIPPPPASSRPTLDPTPIPDLPRKPITIEGRLAAEEVGFLVELERLYKRFRPVPEAVKEMIERSDELVKYFKDRNAGAAEIANEIQKIAKNLVVEKGPFGKEQLVPYTNFLLESARKNHYSVQVIKNTGMSPFQRQFEGLGREGHRCTFFKKNLTF